MKSETLRKLKLLNHRGWRLNDIGPYEYNDKKFWVIICDKCDRKIEYEYSPSASPYAAMGWISEKLAMYDYVTPSSFAEMLIEAYHHDFADELAEKLGQVERLKRKSITIQVCDSWLHATDPEKIIVYGLRTDNNSIGYSAELPVHNKMFPPPNKDDLIEIFLEDGDTGNPVDWGYVLSPPPEKIEPEKYKVEFSSRSKEHGITYYRAHYPGGSEFIGVHDKIEDTPYRGSGTVEAAIKFHKEMLNENIKQACDRVLEKHKAPRKHGFEIDPPPAVLNKIDDDVCRYATPQKIMLPVMDGWERTNKVEEVALKIPDHKMPKRCKGEYGKYAARQHTDEVNRLWAIEQANATARIARLMNWPYCGHTQRNVGVKWIDGVAFWLCEHCAEVK